MRLEGLPSRRCLWSRAALGAWHSHDEIKLMGGDRISLPPSLNGGMVAVAQSTCQRPDAATLCDDGLMAGHVRYVRSYRTSVNDVDNVRMKIQNALMTIQRTGEALLALKKRSGLSLDAIAHGAGYKGRSSVQSFFNAAYERALDTDVAAKLASAFEGKGEPPIERAEVMRLTGAFEGNAVPQPFEGAADLRMRQNLPVLGTALGADRVEGELAIEQTCLYENEIVFYAKRPTILDGRTDAYGLLVQGSSMYPAYPDGETILVETRRPPSIGEYAVVYLRMNGECDEDDHNGNARMVMIKKLVRKSASFIELEQYKPALTFRVDMREVLKMHRVIPWGELLS